jgi:nicotinamidase/pyrazinamidase
MPVRALFWDVDTQWDFMDPGGRLPVPGAEGIVANLRKLTQFAELHGVPIVATADTHTCDDAEFQQFGTHCVAGTPGHEKIAATSVGARVLAREDRLAQQVRDLEAGRTKQMVVEKPSLDAFALPVADAVVSGLRPEHIYVYGVATEYCVLLAVLGLRDRGYVVTVVEDAVRGIDPVAEREALGRMTQAGAHFATTDEVLAAVSR